MSNAFETLSAKQLKQAIKLREKIETLQSQLSEIFDGGEIPAPFVKARKTRKKMSAASRAKIAAGQKKRWAKVNAAKAESDTLDSATAKPKRKMLAAAKAKFAAAAKLRWKTAKAAGKNTL